MTSSIHTASEPSGQELVIVGMAGRRNGPPLSVRYDDDDDSYFKESLLKCCFFRTRHFVAGVDCNSSDSRSPGHH